MNILYLDLDALRPDHLGCGGYKRNTSPHLDRIARQGVMFTNCYCSDAPCAPSRTALMSGMHGIHSGVVGHGGTNGDMRTEGRERRFRTRLYAESLPGFLRSHGYYTASISSFAERHSAYSFYAGFNEVRNTGKNGMESADEVAPVVLDWLQANNKRERWFLHVNFWDVHMPARAPESFGSPLDGDALPEWLSEEKLNAQLAMTGLQMPQEKERAFRNYANGGLFGAAGQVNPPYPRNPQHIRTLDDVRQIVDGYDCGIRYMDEQIGRMLTALEAMGLMEETAIIVSADHGENLGELGVYGDHITADQATMHIPLIFKWPGARQGETRHGLHLHLDLLPTLAELLGVQPPQGAEGISYAGALFGEDDPGRDYAVLSQCAGTCQRSVRFGDWLYIRTYHDGYNPFPREMLFYLAEDPHEERNAADSRPDIVLEAVRMLDSWNEQMMKTMPYGYDADPLWTVIREGGPSHARGALPGLLERLRERGETAQAEQLAAKYR
ncbi:sulfatase [Paenibacillus thalictri]|uniref:Sulfatase n=1 Tax=Paenibacillus thalictri TaxID=2527873 RepID=A0A4Q9DTW0_9BACL|nr:sulfatase [Paenibacillus thalictri]TBL78983.1 sulfatase [Paenibacillus thalictri]